MDSRLKRILSLRTFTARCLSGGGLESFSKETNGNLDEEALRLCMINRLLAYLFKRGGLLASKSDVDFMSFLLSWLINCGNKAKIK